MFEPIWNRSYVDHVQITMAEDIGIGGRAGYYDGIGAARDVIQNHLLQLLALTAMEEPASFDADALAAEKTKVLGRGEAARGPGPATPCAAQYAAGWQGGEKVVGYLEEDGIDPKSKTDTYAAVKLEIDNRRWAGVPFYLRTGKRLGRRVTEIAVVFQRAPHSPFDHTATEELGQNALVIRVQPDEGVTVRFGSKVPGTSMEVRDVSMDFAYGESFTESSPEAYERLILDVLLGDANLFPRTEEVELSWKILDPIEEYWDKHGKPAQYPAGHLGPGRGGRNARTRRTELAPAMKIDLTDTTASKINKALVQGRRAIGTPAVGMVLTLVIVTDEENAYDALKAANDASREHPSRTLVVIKRRLPLAARPHQVAPRRRGAGGRGRGHRRDGRAAAVRRGRRPRPVGGPAAAAAGRAGRRLVAGERADRPGQGPAGRAGAAPGHRHVRRRAARAGAAARAEAYTPGDTDLAWTRITPWRSMLAAALDQVACEVTSVEVEGEEYNPSCELLAMWLADRLDVPVKRSLSSGPGLTAVRMGTNCGPIVLDRADGSLATLSIQGQPDRAVALKRRETAELIAEELRRLDPDDTYASALRFGVERLSGTAGPRQSGGRSAAPASQADVRSAARRGPTARRPRRRRPPGQEGGGEVSAPQLVVHHDKELMAQAAAARLITKIVDAQASRGSASVVLTGGRNGNGLLAALGGLAAPGTRSTGRGSTCGGATSGSCPRATRSAMSRRPARRCWTRCRWTRSGCTRCPRRTARTARTRTRRPRRTRPNWPRRRARRTTVRCRPSTC